MNSQGFSFPPPPPPPPSTSQQQYNHNASFPSQYGRGQRGGRGGGGHNRGRGRGFGNRGGNGGGRGGHYVSPAASTPSVGYNAMNYAGFAAQSLTTPAHGNPAPQFQPSPHPQNYQNSQSHNFPSHQPFAQHPATHGHPYGHQPGYGSAYPSTSTQATSYPPTMAPHQHMPASVQSPMVAPPMRWGFESTAGQPSMGNQHAHQRGARQFNANSHQANYHTSKRDHTSAFGKPHSSAPRVPAPPSVPSFGNPLPSKPPPPVDASRKQPKKKKRKHNQLGLTPKTEEHESSEEDDDLDEESRFALGAADATAPLQFTYRGRTSTLESSADIAAWIEERRKKYPTKAKIEEKKKAMEVAKKARDEATRQREAQKQEAKRQQKEARASKEQGNNNREGQSQPGGDPIDAAEKAKRKADRLRQKLMREQKKVERAEADAERARLKVQQLQQGSTERSQSQSAAEDTHDANDEAAISPSIASDSSDWTSSSGSDDSSSDSEDSGDDSAPEEASSRRAGPERVSPPPRESKKQICRHFARKGHCIRRDKCKFLHEKPEPKPKTKQPPPQPEKQGRKGLLQALLDRQKQDEDRQVMQAIMWLGENEYLNQGGSGSVAQIDGVQDAQGLESTHDINIDQERLVVPTDPVVDMPATT